MKSNYKKLGGYIRQVDKRNSDARLGEDNLYGISVTKEFIISHANLVGVTFDSYKVVVPRQFAYIPDTSRRGDKIAISLNSFGEDIIVSSICSVFEIINENQLLPEYLMLWFMRPEFDRYARFMSNGSAREVFDWDCMCGVELPVPPISEQRKIIHDYQVITSRIELLKNINDNLEAQAQAFFEEKFASMYLSDVLPKGWKKRRLDSICTVKGGKRLPAESELLDYPTAHPYIRVRDVGDNRYVCLTDQFQYIDEETYQAISKYIVGSNDIIISIVGTIGLIGKIHTTLNKANLTENCVKLTDIKEVTPDYLYYTLCMKKNNKEIDLLTVGAVQAKLPMYNIQSIDIVVPPKDLLKAFQNKMEALNGLIEPNTIEIQRLIELRNIILGILTS